MARGTKRAAAAAGGSARSLREPHASGSQRESLPVGRIPRAMSIMKGNSRENSTRIWTASSEELVYHGPDTGAQHAGSRALMGSGGPEESGLNTRRKQPLGRYVTGVAAPAPPPFSLGWHGPSSPANLFDCGL